ncbi:hypothetical protein [Nocardia mangyaensis]
MSEFGVQMYRTRTRRMYPNASAAEIDDNVTCWLLSRRGARGRRG